MRTKFTTRTVVYVDHPDGTKITYKALKARIKADLEERGRHPHQPGFEIVRARVDEVDQK